MIRKKTKTPPDLSKHTGSAIVQAIKALPAKTQGNIIVGATDTADMYGVTFFRHSKHPGKPSVQSHIYTCSGIGSTGVPIGRDKFQQLHVAVVHNLCKDPQIKKHRLSEGYAHPTPRPTATGQKDNGLAPNDEAERLMLKGVDSREAYRQFPPVPAEKPDANLVATLIRELKEEIGLDVSEEQLKCVYEYEDAGKMHMLAKVFLVDVTNHDGLPPLKTNDPQEIAEAKWIPLTNITKTVTKETIKFEIEGVEIPVRYAASIGFALKEFRQLEIQQLGIDLITTADNLRELTKKLFLGDDKEFEQLLGITPAESFSKQFPVELVFGNNNRQKQERSTALAELGLEAEMYHQRLMQLGKMLAERLKGKKLFEIKPVTRDEILAEISKVTAKYDTNSIPQSGMRSACR